MKARQEFFSKVDEIVKEGTALANPIRVLILTIIAYKREVSWYEIKEILEEFIGRANPNTLAFHINKLVELEFIERIGPKRSPRYVIKKIPNEITILIKYFNKVLEERKHG